MTANQKQKILTMRENGEKYSAIAAELGISENTVKSFHRRHDLSAKPVVGDENCRECSKPLMQNKTNKKFCSDKCRMAWWKTHPEAVNRKAVYHFACVLCGTAFESYGNANRKYCSRACYGLSRRTHNE